VSDDYPLRTVKFVPGKDMFICSGDNMTLYTYETSTFKLLRKNEQIHYDYTRGIALHPTEPILITCSDDSSICIRDMETNSLIAAKYNAHSHHVTCIAINPFNTTQFATGGYDTDINIWSLANLECIATLMRHHDFIHSVTYFTNSSKQQLLISTSDDATARIWNVETFDCIYTLMHSKNWVTASCMLAEYSVITTLSHDNNNSTLIFWDLDTFKQVSSTEYHDYNRGWALSAKKNCIAIGFDNGLEIIHAKERNPIPVGLVLCKAYKDLDIVLI
jgi:coatomer subunit beta'